MVKEPEADDNKGPTKKDPNNIVREDFGEKIDLSRCGETSR